MSIKVFRVAEMVAAEKAADAAGVSYDQMMETAGRGVAEAIVERMPVAGRSVLVLVGPGNNGGDGLVAGRYLAEYGADVAFYLYRARDAEEDANYARILEMDLLVVEAQHDQRWRVLRTRLNVTDIVLDALLGTGVTRPIGGELAGLMKQVKAGLSGRAASAVATQPQLFSVRRVRPPAQEQKALAMVAVDVPTGLNSDTGELDPLALPADLTVTFAGPKRGHFMFPGAAAVGELVVADIGIASDLPEVSDVSVTLTTVDWAQALLPARPPDGHKGTFGTALIAAGSADYWGAPVLAAKGAYRSGAGLVALAVPGQIRATVAAQLAEATYPAIPAAASLDEETVGYLLERVQSYDAVLFGPGIGEATGFVSRFLAQGQAWPPLIVDADGLNVLAQMADWPQKLPPETVLTPHPGEMARLMDVPIAQVKEADRVALAREKAQAWGHVVLLKGAYTVVAAPNGQATIIPFANPLLAAGGSGDVLSGVIVALLAQKLPAYEAAVLGAFMHGAAAELARAELGNAGLLAGELADWLPAARKEIAKWQP